MRLLTLTLLIVLLVACGQKDVLYIPEPGSSDSSQESKEKKTAAEDDDAADEDK